MWPSFQPEKETNTILAGLQRVCHEPGCAPELALCQPRAGTSYFLEKHVDLERLGGSPEVTLSGMENEAKGGDKGLVSPHLQEPTDRP